MANRRFGWHSGNLECYDILVNNDFEVKGNFTFGDASTDTLTVTGKLDANGDIDLGSGDDTINVYNDLDLATGIKVSGDTSLDVPGISSASDVSIVSTGTASLTLTSSDGDVNLSDHLKLASGQTIKFPSESTAGTATLSSGSAAIMASAASAGDIAFVQNISGTANAGALAAVVTDGTITVLSANASDANDIAWMLVKVA